jgi:hypothetical protein
VWTLTGLAAAECRALTRTSTLVLTLAILLLALIVLSGLYGFRYTETKSGEEAFNRPLVVKIQDLRSRPAQAVLSAMVAGTCAAAILPLGPCRYDDPHWHRGARRPGVLLRQKVPRPGSGLLLPHRLGCQAAPRAPGAGGGRSGVPAVPRAWQTWRLPGLAPLPLAGFFLCALARGVSNAGIRHALPELVVLGIFGGVALALAATSRSRLAKVMAVVGVTVAAAAVSANARIRPCEYYNELVGGPEKAYLRCADEGIDMGQRSLDLVRYYHERLEPAGEVPYSFYQIRRQELQRRNLFGSVANLHFLRLAGHTVLHQRRVSIDPQRKHFRLAMLYT